MFSLFLTSSSPHSELCKYMNNESKIENTKGVFFGFFKQTERLDLQEVDDY